MQSWQGGTYSSFQAVTPSDTTLINCRALYIGTGGGTLALSPNGTTPSVTFTAPLSGTILPIELNEGRVMATGTATTANIVALS